MEAPRVLSIQSHTVHGYVGNKSAVFPLQLLGVGVVELGKGAVAGGLDAGEGHATMTPPSPRSSNRQPDAARRCDDPTKRNMPETKGNREVFGHPVGGLRSRFRTMVASMGVFGSMRCW